MIKKHKNLYIALIILCQSALSIFVGLLIFFLVAQKSIAPGMHVAGIDVGGMTGNEANQKIDSIFGDTIKNGSFDIVFGGNKRFKIKYSDINASIDNEASITMALGKNVKAFIYQFNGYFFNERNDIFPVISYSEDKLKDKLKELANLIQKAPVNANIELINGKVIKKTEVEGSRLNLDNAYKKLLNEIPKKIGTDIEFYKGGNQEVENILPQFSVSDFNGADEVISQYSTKIKSLELEGSIKTAVHAINKVVLFSKDLRRGLNAGTFSFNKYLALDGAVMEENSEGYNQVVSTLNAAVLNSEIDKNSIIRTQHKSTVDYIDPGLDAMVLSSKYDYKFKNTSDNVLIIFAQIIDDKVIVSLVGKKRDDKVKNTLEIEVIQRFDPSVVNMENQDLKSGEKKMISAGKEGVKVNVYRVTSQDGSVTNKTLIYNNMMYDAVKAVVQTGPSSPE